MATTYPVTASFDVGFERSAAARTSKGGRCERLVVNVAEEGWA